MAGCYNTERKILKLQEFVYGIMVGIQYYKMKLFSQFSKEPWVARTHAGSQNQFQLGISCFWLRFSFLCYFLLIGIGHLDNNV